MLRLLVLALLVANLGYFAWACGTFADFGWAPARLSETEPQRFANQLRPSLLRVRTEDASPASASVAASAPEPAASAASAAAVP